jgi:DNA-binding transcriptional regulator YhcF (GntR family)
MSRKPKTAPAVEATTEPEEELFSISRLAEHFGLDRATMRKRLKFLEPVRETKREKLYLLADAELAVEQAEDTGYKDSKRRKVASEAALLELKLQRQRGEVVEIRAVREELQEIFKRLYQRLAVQYPREIAAQLYKAESAGQITEILRHDMGRMFNDLRSDYKSFF